MTDAWYSVSLPWRMRSFARASPSAGRCSGGRGSQSVDTSAADIRPVWLRLSINSCTESAIGRSRVPSMIAAGASGPYGMEQNRALRHQLALPRKWTNVLEAGLEFFHAGRERDTTISFDP